MNIGEGAFKGCYKLIEVYNLSSLNIVAKSSSDGYVAYYAKDIYTSLDKKSKLTTTVDGFIFYDDTKRNKGYYLIGSTVRRSEMTLPKNFNGSSYKIYNYAFASCVGLAKITISDGVISIGEHAFDACYSLISIIISDSVKDIGDGAFNSCYKLIEICNLSTLNIIAGKYDNGEVAREAKNVYTATKGKSMLTITDDGFVFYDDSTDYKGWRYLIGYIGGKTEITLPQNFGGRSYDIYKWAFVGNDSLTRITISSGVTDIGRFAFIGCKSLIKVDIPDSVTSVGDCAFANCALLTSIIIPDSVADIGWSICGSCSPHLMIYCRNLKQPSGWNSEWNFIDDNAKKRCKVIWGYTGK